MERLAAFFFRASKPHKMQKQTDIQMRSAAPCIIGGRIAREERSRAARNKNKAHYPADSHPASESTYKVHTMIFWTALLIIISLSASAEIRLWYVLTLLYASQTKHERPSNTLMNSPFII